MSVSKNIYGLRFSTYTKSAMVMSTGGSPDGSISITPAPPIILVPTPWAYWGSDNLLPLKMVDDIENCGILNAAINAKSLLTVGKGLQPFLLTGIDKDGTEMLDWVLDHEISDWLDDNCLYDKTADFAYDSIAFGFRVGTLMLSKDRKKINKVFRKDVTEVRFAKKNDAGFIENIFLSSNWDKANAATLNKFVVPVPALKEGFEYDDFVARSGSGSFEYAFIDRPRRNSRQYYPFPMWYSAKEWVKVARSIPSQKNAIFKNQILLKYVVTIHERFWTDKVAQNWVTLDMDERKALQDEVYDHIDSWLAGTDNAGKTLFAGTFTQPGVSEPIPYVKVEAIDDKFSDGKLLPDSSAANVEILMALLTNPAFIGAGGVGGKAYGSQSGGSNIRESYMTQIMLMEAERKRSINFMNWVARYNGWTEKYNTDTTRLVWRYQSNLLTTLDTGKSTKAENL